jgi:hypothetical protein
MAQPHQREAADDQRLAAGRALQQRREWHRRQRVDQRGAGGHQADQQVRAAQADHVGGVEGDAASEDRGPEDLDHEIAQVAFDVLVVHAADLALSPAACAAESTRYFTADRDFDPISVWRGFQSANCPRLSSSRV